jgi:hypothetical protein
MQVTSLLNVTLVLAMHGHVMFVLITDGQSVGVCAAEGVEQTNSTTPSATGAAVQLKPFLVIVLVRKVISRMVLLRRPSIRPSP